LSSSSTSQTLPNPDGPLSKKVLSKVIKLANAEVTLLKESLCGHRSPYLIFTPAQYEVGKRAAEHRATASLRLKISFLRNCSLQHFYYDFVIAP